jgi:hypothetical protein
VSDRGRDVGDELTEVRTVLSRAETALMTLRRYRDREITKYRVRTADDPPGREWVDDRTPDVDVHEMIAALNKTVALLGPWRRTGKAKR